MWAYPSWCHWWLANRCWFCDRPNLKCQLVSRIIKCKDISIFHESLQINKFLPFFVLLRYLASIWPNIQWDLLVDSGPLRSNLWSKGLPSLNKWVNTIYFRWKNEFLMIISYCLLLAKYCPSSVSNIWIFVGLSLLLSRVLLLLIFWLLVLLFILLLLIIRFSLAPVIETENRKTIFINFNSCLMFHYIDIYAYVANYTRTSLIQTARVQNIFLVLWEIFWASYQTRIGKMAKEKISIKWGILYSGNLWIICLICIEPH